MQNQQIVLGFCFVLIASCSPKTDKHENGALEKKAAKHEFALNEEFNVEIRPDTTLSWYPIDGLKSRHSVTNKRFVVQKSLNQLVLNSKDNTIPL